MSEVIEFAKHLYDYMYNYRLFEAHYNLIRIGKPVPRHTNPPREDWFKYLGEYLDIDARKHLWNDAVVMADNVMRQPAYDWQI